MNFLGGQTSLTGKIEKYANIRPDPENIAIQNIDLLVHGKKIRNLYDLQEKYNKKPTEVRSSSRICFGVLLERMLTEVDLNFKEPVEVWTVSDFHRSLTSRQTISFMFVSGDLLKNIFRKKSNDELCGQIVLFNGLRILPGMTYAEFKNKFSSKKKKGGTKLSLAMSTFREKDVIFIGKCRDYARCEYNVPTTGKCDDIVNTGRNAIANHIRRKKKRAVFCHIHQNLRIQESGNRMDISQPLGGASFVRDKPSFAYCNAVYTFLNRNVFINPKGFRKMKRIRRTRKRKDERKEEEKKHFTTNLPERLTSGQRMMMFQLKKTQREKMEDIIRKKDQNATNLQVKQTAMKIATTGLLAPKIARGVKRKKSMVFSLSDSDSDEKNNDNSNNNNGRIEDEDEDEEDLQPPMKKRKLD